MLWKECNYQVFSVKSPAKAYQKFQVCQKKHPTFSWGYYVIFPHYVCFFLRGFRSSKTDNIFIQCNELQGTTTANSYFFGSARARLQGHQQVVILLSMVMLCYQAMETGPFGRHGSFTYYSTPQPEFGGAKRGWFFLPGDFESTTWFLHNLCSDDHPN